jgi:hypothetical protein
MYFRGLITKLLERCISRGLTTKLLCEVCLLSGFQLEMGSELKENRCRAILHPSYDKFPLQLYMAELRLRTPSNI